MNKIDEVPVKWFTGGDEGWPIGHAPAYWDLSTAEKAVSQGWRMSAGGWWHGPDGEMVVDTAALWEDRYIQ